jgi:putative secretion ATPase (PEP-CTERM system associated)
MYTAFYKLAGKPFQLSPDHRFFFGGRSHKRAMAYLSYGLSEREGFIVITGEVGAGKTTIVRHLLDQIDKGQYVSASVVTSLLEGDDALRMVASAFKIPVQATDKATLLRAIEAFLIDRHRAGKHVVLVVDEVQNMRFSALEELRMLSNFQVGSKSLLQCFLLGQPEFRPILASDQLEQLRQRVIASCHLEPLEPDETREYVLHRLRLVGWNDDPSLTDGAFSLIHRHTGGVPRRINNLCSRLLLTGALEGLHHIDETVVMEVVREVGEEEGRFIAPEHRPAPVLQIPAAPQAAMPSPHRPQPIIHAPAPSGGEPLDELLRRVAALKKQA